MTRGTPGSRMGPPYADWSPGMGCWQERKRRHGSRSTRPWRPRVSGGFLRAGHQLSRDPLLASPHVARPRERWLAPGRDPTGCVTPSVRCDSLCGEEVARLPRYRDATPAVAGPPKLVKPREGDLSPVRPVARQRCVQTFNPLRGVLQNPKCNTVLLLRVCNALQRGSHHKATATETGQPRRIWLQPSAASDLGPSACRAPDLLLRHLWRARPQLGQKNGMQIEATIARSRLSGPPTFTKSMKRYPPGE